MATVQVDLTAQMRAILVDWLVEVAEEYRLLPETLYLAVALVDRSLSSRVESRGRLQLLGCAAMLVAAKYEEIYAPAVNEFVYISVRAPLFPRLLMLASQYVSFYFHPRH